MIDRKSPQSTARLDNYHTEEGMVNGINRQRSSEAGGKELDDLGCACLCLTQSTQVAS